jgi:hypothetical protein
MKWHAKGRRELDSPKRRQILAIWQHLYLARIPNLGYYVSRLKTDGWIGQWTRKCSTANQSKQPANQRNRN